MFTASYHLIFFEMRTPCGHQISSLFLKSRQRIFSYSKGPIDTFGYFSDIFKFILFCLCLVEDSTRISKLFGKNLWSSGTLWNLRIKCHVHIKGSSKIILLYNKKYKHTPLLNEALQNASNKKQLALEYSLLPQNFHYEVM